MRNHLQLALKGKLMNFLICEATKMILKRYLQMRCDRVFFLPGFFLSVLLGLCGCRAVRTLRPGSKRIQRESMLHCRSLLGDLRSGTNFQLNPNRDIVVRIEWSYVGSSLGE